MKYNILFLIMIVFISLPLFFNKNDVHSEQDDAAMIDSFERDMTGDGFQEYIKLQGNTINNKSSFYQDVWMTVQNPFKKEWSISMQHGYEPDFSLIDLTGDKNPDIFYKVGKDEKLEHFHYQLYHFDKDKIQAIDLPNHRYIQAKFADDFTMKISVNPAKSAKAIDLSNKKDTYIENGIYNENGKPTEKERPKISQNVNMKPLLISDSKGYGLKASNSVLGMNENDIIGKLETIWFYEKGEWINLKTEVLTED